VGRRARPILFRQLAQCQRQSVEDNEKGISNSGNGHGKAEGKMDPILVVFNDQVLFLKHNLNARAIASIQDEVTVMEEEVANLIVDMNAAIAEAESFVKQLKIDEEV
jgi:hypothetical protein